MSLPAQMLGSHPAASMPVANNEIAGCIQACVECAQACVACADACLAEPMVAELVRCITTDLNCADICESTGRVLTRQAGADRATIFRMLQSCAAACRACGDECETHSEAHAHCQLCAAACRRCEQACRDLLDTLPVA